MPTVPVLTAPGESLQPLPGGGLRPALSAPDQGSQADLTRGLAKFGDAIGAIALKEQAKANESAILQGETELDSAYREFKNSQVNRVGHSASGITVGAEKWWNENATRISKGMNEPQRRVFLARADAKRGSILDSFSAFEATETRKARAEDRDASTLGAIRHAADAPTDTNINAALALITANARGWAVDNGLDLNNPEQGARYDEYLLQSKSKLHNTVIAALSSKPETAVRAAEYFKAYGAEMAIEDRVQAQKSVETASVGVRAQTVVDALYAKHGTNSTAALDELRAMFTPEDQAVEVEASARLLNRYREDAAVAEAKQRPLTEQALSIFNANGGNWTAIPAPIRAGMDQATLRRLMDGKDALTRYARQTFDGLRGLAYMNPEAFLATDLTDPALGLDARYRADLQALQSRVRSDSDARGKERQRIFIGQAFDGRIASAGITDAKDVTAARAQFTNAYAAEIESFRLRNKRPPDDAEAAQIAGNLLIYGEFEDTINDDEGFVFEAAKYPGQPFVPTSAADVAQTRAEAFLRGTGQDVTPAGMQQYADYRARAVSFLKGQRIEVNENEIAKLISNYYKQGSAAR